MNQAELILFDQSEKCTIYSIRFLNDEDSEVEKFYAKFKESSEYNADFERIISVLFSMLNKGAPVRYFRYEGKMKDNVVALPVLKSKLRLYCLRLSDKIIVVGNGGIKNTRTYEEDDELRGYVLSLQQLDKLLKEGIQDGSIVITENRIDADKTFQL